MRKIYFSAVPARPPRALMPRSIFFLLLLVACMYAGPLPAQKKAAAVPPQTSPALTYKIIPAANGTYGYDIFTDGRLHIHQPSIPALPGNDGFKTQAAAGKVARLAIIKMKKGESLPTISPDELKKLGAR